MDHPNKNDFQTPHDVAAYMVSLIPGWCKTILEPTPGAGNIVAKLNGRGGVRCNSAGGLF